MKKRFSILLLLIPLIALSRNSDKSPPNSEPALLQGYVTDAVTKRPVPGVTVCASTTKGSAPMMEAITDAEGFFHFTQLPSQLVNLQFDKKGYQLYRKSGVLIQEKATTKIHVEFLRQNNLNFDEEEDYIILRMLEIN